MRFVPIPESFNKVAVQLQRDNVSALQLFSLLAPLSNLDNYSLPEPLSSELDRLYPDHENSLFKNVNRDVVSYFENNRFNEPEANMRMGADSNYISLTTPLLREQSLRTYIMDVRNVGQSKFHNQYVYCKRDNFSGFAFSNNTDISRTISNVDTMSDFIFVIRNGRFKITAVRYYVKDIGFVTCLLSFALMAPRLTHLDCLILARFGVRVVSVGLLKREAAKNEDDFIESIIEDKFYLLGRGDTNGTIVSDTTHCKAVISSEVGGKRVNYFANLDSDINLYASTVINHCSKTLAVKGPW